MVRWDFRSALGKARMRLEMLQTHQICYLYDQPHKNYGIPKLVVEISSIRCHFAAKSGHYATVYDVRALRAPSDSP